MKKLDCLKMKRTKEIVAPVIQKKRRIESDSEIKSLYDKVTSEYDDIFYPSNVTKYIGSLRQATSSKWYTMMKCQGGCGVKKTTFDTEDEAKEFIIESNKKAGLCCIRNITYFYDGRYYCDLNAQNRFIIISNESIPVIDKHIVGQKLKTTINGEYIEALCK